MSTATVNVIRLAAAIALDAAIARQVAAARAAAFAVAAEPSADADDAVWIEWSDACDAELAARHVPAMAEAGNEAADDIIRELRAIYAPMIDIAAAADLVANCDRVLSGSMAMVDGVSATACRSVLVAGAKRLVARSAMSAGNAHVSI